MSGFRPLVDLGPREYAVAAKKEKSMTESQESHEEGEGDRDPPEVHAGGEMMKALEFFRN